MSISNGMQHNTRNNILESLGNLVTETILK